MIERVAVLVNLLVATSLAVFYVPFPESTDAIIHFLVKKVERMIVYGESYSQRFCNCVQTDREDACSVAETNEQDDGQDGSINEDESGRTGELESDGGKDD